MWDSITGSPIIDVLDILIVAYLLERAGVLVSGAFTPGASGEEWVGADTLRRMHRRTLTLLRRRTARCGDTDPLRVRCRPPRRPTASPSTPPRWTTRPYSNRSA